MKKAISFPRFHHKHLQNPIPLDTERSQRLAEVGQQLRQTRLHHSFSIDLVAAYTRIRPNLLQALEEGNLENLPEAVYTQGLIRRYGDALGLNGRELASLFCPEPIESSFKARRRSLSLPQLRPSHLYLTYILLIIFAVNGLAYLIRTPGELEQLSQSPETIEGVQASSTPIPIAQTPQPTATATQPAITTALKQQNQDVQVGVRIKDESWVLVEIDGKPEFQGILPGGTQRTWKAKNELLIRAGNAGGVIVTVNNGEAKQLGEPGAVEEAVFKVDPAQETPKNSNS
ncbi:MAG: helix-turn-helix domain-containing protein [Oscillatoriales cyanobacterium RM1_1_9]|nr:helix-turn-helix domain-containing protein [Oscillatoriales cyanobacterium SM2_3_0]NJO47827.1 helix-turn-helix domain-containing protein [Oscillatoriales cyanobacterium RM2_1_1]NJO72073.1 helix-turn-helix domain-containing protein [Oscillatoriales cyanobacterium RM1_1_9]